MLNPKLQRLCSKSCMHVRNVWDAQRIERAYILEGPKAAGRTRKTANIPFADCDADQLAKEELVQLLNACTTNWKHDWQTQPRLPIKYEQDEFDELFQETGIAVLQFAKGDELKRLQEEAVDRATRLSKITIHNETEVIESVPTANEMGGVTHPPLRSTARGSNLIYQKVSQCRARRS